MFDQTLIMKRSQRIFYLIFTRFACVVLRVWVRLSIKGKNNLPESGGFILAPGGHRSYLDTPVTACSTRRILRFIGADGFFKKPVLAGILYAFGGFPVDRENSDRQAMKKAEAILESGQPMVMFPEGTRLTGPKIDGIKPGVAFLSCRTGVPIIPVGLGGIERSMPKGSIFVKPTKVVVVIGEPLVPPAKSSTGRVKRSEVDAFNKVFEEKLQQVFDQASKLAG